MAIDFDKLTDSELENLEFEDVEQEYNNKEWRPETAGDYLIGRYIVSENGHGKAKDYIFHYIRDTKGDERSIFGCVSLNTLLEKVEQGDIIKIIFDGMKTSENGRRYKAFRVQRPKAE